jgi:hypothetical protein
MWTLPRPVLPCPYCGGTEMLGLSIGASGGVLQCRTCHAQGPPAATHDLTLRAWDTRGRPLPRPCRWCQRVYEPHRLTQQYCKPRCAQAALRKLREAEQRALDKERRRQAHQQAQAQERAARAQELAQQQWLLASS